MERVLHHPSDADRAGWKQDVFEGAMSYVSLLEGSHHVLFLVGESAVCSYEMLDITFGLTGITLV